MKAILISIDPKWACKELNGIKPLEVRTGLKLHNAIQKLIKEQGTAPMLIYVTKSRKNILHKNCAGIWWLEDKAFQRKNEKLGLISPPSYNGKVVARCNATSELIEYNNFFGVHCYDTKTKVVECLLSNTCLSIDEMHKYLKGKKDGEIVGTVAKLNDLKSFNKPKEIGEFNAYCKGGAKCLHCKHHWTDDSSGCSIDKCSGKPLTSAPQSWYYIEI